LINHCKKQHQQQYQHILGFQQHTSTNIVYRCYPGSIFTQHFYRAMPASAVLAMALCPSVCPSVCLSVTSRCSTKTAKRRITQTKPYDSPGTLVFGCQRSPRNSTGVTPTRAPNAGGVGQNQRLLINSRLYLENGTR